MGLISFITMLNATSMAGEEETHGSVWNDSDTWDDNENWTD